MTAEILQAYSMIGRSRQYVGMMGAPAPITLGIITDYLAIYPTSLGRAEFDAAILALDDEFRTNWAEHQERTNPEKIGFVGRTQG
ncbi:hypothetical protein C1893_01695 [Pseudomonas sp. MPR-ANC1]|nr:hypothetical protein C1893_01695 [Pseudomonas sp. MPR-ANC1]